MTDLSADLRKCIRLTAQIEPILHGQGPGAIGAVLADLLSKLLAGHFIAGDEKATAELRDEILSAHIDAVRKLVPVNEKIILDRAKREAH